MSKHCNRGIAVPTILLILLILVGLLGWFLYFKNQQALAKLESTQLQLQEAEKKNAELESSIESLRNAHITSGQQLDVMSAQVGALEEKAAQTDGLKAALDKSYADIKQLTNERDEARTSDLRGREQLSELGHLDCKDSVAKLGHPGPLRHAFAGGPLPGLGQPGRLQGARVGPLLEEPAQD
ncbi:MAG: hypothetical protein AAF420_16110, partial [Pseudomonadota bacterium]